MRHIPSLFGLLFSMLLLLFSAPATAAAREGLSLWWTVVLPTLFPFFVCASLLQQSGALERMAKALIIKKGAGRSSGYALPVFLLSAASGYPAAAKLCAGLLQAGAVTPQEAERLATACNLCSPMFLLGALSLGILQSAQLFVPLLAAHYISALACFFLYPLLFPIKDASVPRRSAPPPIAFTKALPAAIADGMWSMVKVCGSIVFCMVLSVCVQQTVLLLVPAAGDAKGGFAVFLGLLEMTGGCYQVAALGLSLRAACTLCCALVSFGGLSVWMQVLSFLPLAHPLRYLLVKALHGLLAGGICWLLFPLFPSAAPAFASAASIYASNALSGAALLFCAALSLAVALLLSVFAGAVNKKAGKTPHRC